MLKKILTLTIILTRIIPSSGQIIKSLDYNHAVIKANEERKKIPLKSIGSDTIYFDSEFFEDFSSYHYEIFPRPNVWADQYAFINSTYADSMISLGVATLDAYDQKGFPYYSSLNKVAESDTLTSQIFVFNEIPEDTLFFSFFYQCGGKVSEPEITDTLILDFYSSEDTAWIMAHYLLGGEQMHTFEQVIIPVADSLIADGFRFRFRNYTSLALENIPGLDLGKFSNADQWHIDYIQIKSVTNRLSLTYLDDMTVVEPLLPTFTEYSTVPYKHLTFAQSAVERRTIPFSYRTIFPNMGTIVSLERYYFSYDLGTGELLRYLKYNENVEPFTYHYEEEYFTSGYTYKEEDTIGELELIAVINANSIDQNKINDTVKRREVYHDSYAYDDGTAELGLGISGEHQDLNRIAVRFRIFRRSNNPDTLKAVLIYFNKSIDDYTSESEYRISIRKNDGEKPASDTLYTSNLYFPNYSTRLNEFTRIELDRPIVVSDTFFIVIEQLDSYLNIGYDINNDNLRNIFFYTGQSWENSYSLPKGSLMVRPSFGNYTLPLTKTKSVEIAETLKIFPNPASEVLYIKLPHNGSEIYSVKVYNIMGVILMHLITDNNTIDISSLEKGMYILQLSSFDGEEKYTTKFIKE